MLFRSLVSNNKKRIFCKAASDDIMNNYNSYILPFSVILYSDLNKKEFKVNLEADSEMKIGQIIDVLISRSMKQGLAAEIYDLSKEPYQSGKVTKQEVPVRNGIKQEDAKKIVKLIKDSGLKVQAAIMDDIIRVTGKKIDDLQDVIQASKTWETGIALQVVNMK